MSPRAPSLSPDERRKAIVEVLVPMLAERGGEVSTREIARAAGIAEGTIFKVFGDKRSLMLAAAEEAINPSGAQEDFEAAMAAVGSLREQLVLVTDRVRDRMRLTLSVMVACREHLVAAHHEQHAHAGAGGRQETGKMPMPPAFVLKAQEDLHRRLTSVFEPHRDELEVSPEVAAVALRSLIFGSSRPELGMAAVMTTDQIVDIVLDGVRKEGN